MVGIDLQAATRELAYPDGIPVTLPNGQVITAPAEFPLDVLDPLLSEDLDLIGVVKLVVDREPRVGEDGETVEDDIATIVVDVLMERPAILAQVKRAIGQCFAALFSEEDYARFVAARLGVRTLAALVKGLLSEYGVGLGEALGSPASSESSGEPSSPTSDGSTDSTPAKHAAARTRRKGSSASVAS